MNKASEIKIGPWPAGINLLDKPDQIENNNAAWIVNFDVDNTGLLIPRRGIEHSSAGAASVVKYLLGTAILDGETISRVLVGSQEGGGTTFYALDNPRSALGTNTAPVKFSDVYSGTYKSVVQYQNKFWYVPAVSSSLGYSSPASATNTPTSVASLPYGDYGFVLKDRMFVIRKVTSEVFFSKATDFTNWTAPDGGVIRVNPGDNKPITKVVILNNQIVIFKRTETYILSFTNSPTGDGVLRQVSPDQGALDAITYNNEVYCFNNRSVFKFINGFFQDIGAQLNLNEIGRLDRGTVDNSGKINIVGDTLVVGLRSTLAAAMNLNTGAWSLYTVHSKFANVFSTAAVTGRGSSLGQFVVFGDSQLELHSMFVERSVSAGLSDFASDEAPRLVEYELFTKIIDLNDSQVFKRLYNWFADIEFPTSYIFGQVGFLINSRATDFRGRPSNESYINSAGGLIGPTTSARFKSIQFCFQINSLPPTTDRVRVAPIIRYIKAKVGIKANTSKTVVSIG